MCKSKYKIVAFSGTAGSGKDTCAELLKELVGRESLPFTTNFSFAEPLKKCVAALLGVPVSFLSDSSFKDKQFGKHGYTPRWYLQHFADCIKDFFDDPDIFTRLASEKLKAFIELSENFTEDTLVIFTDVRFASEVDMIHTFGGVVVNITGRSSDIGKNAAHKSESLVKDLKHDFVINNTGTLDDLKNNLKDILCI